jgi:hypothetical protein
MDAEIVENKIDAPEFISGRRSKNDSDAMGPLFPALIALVAGLCVAGPLVGRLLYRMGHKTLGWSLGIVLAMGGLAINAGIVMWGIKQYWSSLILISGHVVFAALIFICLLGPWKRFSESHRTSSPQRGSYRNILTGIVMGGLIAGLFGLVSLSLYLLVSDRLFSTLAPVAFEDHFMLFLLGIAWVPILISGMAAGGILGWMDPGIKPGKAIVFALTFIWIQLSWLAGLQLAIAVPGFQAGAATDQGWQAVIVPFTFGQFVIGLWWCIIVQVYLFKGKNQRALLLRSSYVPVINFAAAVALAIIMGYPADMFLAIGRRQERRGHISKALWCYEKGLVKEPGPKVASYLQYRSALIYHKLGRKDFARKGFRRVVTKYTVNPVLVTKANRFLDNLERATPDLKRVALPGVETQTEYKGGYCVPNSLALAMRYWGSDVDARTIGADITGIGTGTYVVDQRWYAEQQKYNHDFLPLASLEDVKQCIDAGFPVLVYVPSHVFAIVGYDDILETFITYDVALQDVWAEYLQEDFIKAWKKQATTLVLAYPPDKADLIPDSIRSRLKRLSDNYLHFQLHYFDTPDDTISAAHLEKAAGEKADFFFPVTILYSEFPSLREHLDRKYDAESISQAIVEYFGNDFDEGVHLAGQYHDKRWAMPDWALKYSVEYLLGQQKIEKTYDLLSRIDDQGKLSPKMQYYRGILALTKGEFEIGLDRLTRAESESRHFYKAMACLETGNRPEAVTELVSLLKGCT